MKNYKLVLVLVAALFVFSAQAVPSTAFAGEDDWGDWGYSEGPVDDGGWGDWGYSEGPVDDGGWGDWGYEEGYVEDYGYEEYYEPEYYQETYGGGYGGGMPRFSMPSFGGQSYSRPIGYSYSAPTFHAPSYSAPAPVSNVNNNTNVNNIVNNNNSTAIAIATVSPAPVQTQVQYVQPVIHPQPYCTITITNYGGGAYGQHGQTQLATLTWSSTNGTYGFISPNVGTVSGYGTMQVYPVNGQVYTMTVYGQGGSATCSTQPVYMAPVVPQTPYVSLSQIPYTGLELGTAGNVIYWFSLVSFALAAAYLVLYFNGGVLSTLGFQKSQRFAVPPITVTRSTVAQAPRETAPVVSPIQLQRTSDSMELRVGTAEIPRIVISRQ